jgi:phage regulator Rha-like protein
LFYGGVIVNILNSNRSTITEFLSTANPQLSIKKTVIGDIIMSNSLVFLSKENTPLTTSEIIADALNKEHKDVMSLIKKYRSNIENFGVVTFKTKLLKRGNRNGSQEKTIAYLNEQQSTIVICLMRNSPKVLEFKVRLVKAFFEMRQQLQLQNQPKTNALPNYYTTEQIKELKDKARKQGYAIACQYLKKDENGLTERDRKQLEKAKAFIDWYSEKRVNIHDTWKLQRELTHELRELTYKLEQSGDLLSLLFGGYVGTLSEVSYYLNNKLQETNK